MNINKKKNSVVMNMISDDKQSSSLNDTMDDIIKSIPKKITKNDAIYIKVPSELKRKLNEKAKKLNVSVSEALLVLIEKFTEDME